MGAMCMLVVALSGSAFLFPSTLSSRAAQAPQASAMTLGSVAHEKLAATGNQFVVGATFAATAMALLYANRHRSDQRQQHINITRCKVSPDSFEGVCEQTGITLTRYLMELSKRKLVDEDLVSVFDSIREATKVIAKLVNTAPLQAADLLGLQGEINVQGEDQKKLDVITNEVFKSALKYTGKLGTLASEEEDDPVLGTSSIPNLSEEYADTGKYVCVFDPLDGSSNVDAGIPVGTIFGVFNELSMEDCNIPDDREHLTEAEQQCLAGALQPGKALVASGYILYSASTEFVLTIGKGVVGFTLDTSIGEFVLTRPKIEIPPRGKIYSLNQANRQEWDEPMRQYISAIQEGKGETGKPYSLRYIGSMVGDIHRTLLYGGIFAYPADTKNQDGKLRLLYEGAPMSFLMEQAGGKSITGHSRVLDIPPAKVHQRIPVIMGSKEDVEECQKFYEKSDDPVLKKRCENRLQGILNI